MCAALVDTMLIKLGQLIFALIGMLTYLSLSVVRALAIDKR